MIDEAREHRIKTMKDFLLLSRDERIRLIPDLIAWADMVDEINARPDLLSVAKVVPEFTWIDDGSPARVSGVEIGKHRVMFGKDTP